MNVTVVLGTGRADNKSQHVAAAIAEKLRERGTEPTSVSVSEHMLNTVTTPPWRVGGANSEPTEWKRIATETDVFVFVLPEYNHSFPGEWKLLMDSLHDEYAGKTAFIATVSKGRFGGARLMEHVLPVLLYFKLQVAAARLYVAHVNDVFDTQGSIIDEDFRPHLDTFVGAILDT